MITNREVQFWDERYSQNETAYGTTPNLFFKKFIDEVKTPGNLLLPCEGEGRNAIYAAQKGWNVDAFDFSEAAVKKALAIATQQNISINYTQNSIENFRTKKLYDLIAVIYVHQHPNIKTPFFKYLIQHLKTGGSIIFEVFNKNQINYKSGGPKNIDLLYSTEELKNYFVDLNIVLFEEKIIHLTEGEFHKGDASIIRMIAKK